MTYRCGSIDEFSFELLGGESSFQFLEIGIEDRIGAQLAGSLRFRPQVGRDQVEERQDEEDRTELELDGQQH